MRRQIFSVFVVIYVLLLTGCASQKNAASISDAHDLSVRTQGIGTGVSFSSQEPGERFTTKAPHNQIYLYAFDNSVFAKKYHASLNAQANYLIAHPGARVLLAGHTDSRGSREYNIALGERRAKSVYDFLRIAGVSKKQIRLVSYGEERPVSFGHSEENYRLNRRVELIYEALR